jgi:small-conductance mechanosensitive channel
MHELIGVVALVLIPGIPLTFTWPRFFRQRASGPRHGLLTLEFPLFIVTGSYLLFLVLLIFLLLTMSFPLGIENHIAILIWSNIGVSLAMSALAIAGKHPLRWRLAGSAAAVFLVWLAVGIFGVVEAGRWVV